MNKSIKNIKLKDLTFVILYAIVLSILFGIMIGLVDTIINSRLNFSLSFIFFFLSSMWLGRNIRRQYDYPNLYYVIIAFIGLMIQAVIVLVLHLTSVFYPNTNMIQHPELFLNELFYFDFILDFIKGTFSGGFFNTINHLITYLFYGVGIYIGLRETY